MIMSTERLKEYLEPLLSWPYDHIRNIRLGTKALGYWPYRFTTDSDADELLRFIERMANADKQVAVMTHFSHPRELETDAARAAIRRLRDAGAVLRAQAPIVRHVNDRSDTWADMWCTMTRLGVSPYYMFVERDTGASNYFELPLYEAYHVYRDAFASVSGLAKTARGPVMSATPGKVVIDGIATIAGSKVFCCRFIQARNPDWVGRPFFAQYDEQAKWFDDLRPAFDRQWFWDKAGRYANATFSQPSQACVV
jgi:L-lysine 2,3-aminomutase